MLINIAMSEDILSSEVDTATKMITDTAAEGVEFIFGTAFKEDMNDEMTITVIAAGFDDADSDVIPINNPLLDEDPVTPAKATKPNDMQDDDLDEIFKILDKK